MVCILYLYIIYTNNNTKTLENQADQILTINGASIRPYHEIGLEKMGEKGRVAKRGSDSFQSRKKL